MVRLIKEARNPANDEINKKIVNTIKTKVTKELRYKADLEAEGFSIIDNKDSTYNNWTVVGTNKHTVCLSKGRDNKPRIYDGFSPIGTKDAIDDFDFYNYLTLNMDDRRDYHAHGGVGKTNNATSGVMWRMRDGSAVDANFEPTSKTTQYKNLKNDIAYLNRDKKFYADEIKTAKDKLASLELTIANYNDKDAKADLEIAAKLDEIDKLLKDMKVRASSNESLRRRGLRETKSEDMFLGMADNNRTAVLKMMDRFDLSADAVLGELLQFLPNEALDGFVDSYIRDNELDEYED